MKICKIDENISLEFPTDLRSLYRLKAWLFPRNFKDSDLKTYKVDF